MSDGCETYVREYIHAFRPRSSPGRIEAVPESPAVVSARLELARTRAISYVARNLVRKMVPLAGTANDWMRWYE